MRSKTTPEGERGREAGEMRGGGEEGIRLRDKTAGTGCWLEADLIVHLSFPKSLCEQEKRREACWAQKVLSPSFNIIFIVYFFSSSGLQTKHIKTYFSSGPLGT